MRCGAARGWQSWERSAADHTHTALCCRPCMSRDYKYVFCHFCHERWVSPVCVSVCVLWTFCQSRTWLKSKICCCCLGWCSTLSQFWVHLFPTSPHAASSAAGFQAVAQLRNTTPRYSGSQMNVTLKEWDGKRVCGEGPGWAPLDVSGMKSVLQKHEGSHDECVLNLYFYICLPAKRFGSVSQGAQTQKAHLSSWGGRAPDSNTFRFVSVCFCTFLVSFWVLWEFFDALVNFQSLVDVLLVILWHVGVKVIFCVLFN